MKLLLSISLVALATTVYSQSNPYSYLSKNGTEWWADSSEMVPLLFDYNLKGQVRSYSVSEFSAADTFRTRTNTMSANKEVFFDEDGKITAENYYAPDGFLTWKVLYKNYAEQQTSDYRGFSRRGRFLLVDSSVYNKDGLPIHESVLDSTGKYIYNYNYELRKGGDTMTVFVNKKFNRVQYLRGQKIYEYYPGGFRKGQYDRIKYPGDSTVIERFSYGKRYEESVIDKWGHEVTRRQFDESGVPEQTWRRSYADPFQLVLDEYSFRDDNGKTTTISTTYQYQSKILQRKETDGKNAVILKYNDKGDVISMERAKLKTTYAYEYDDRGNWIQRDESVNGKPTMKWKRQISYY
jgi:hypothetical protein